MTVAITVEHNEARLAGTLARERIETEILAPYLREGGQLYAAAGEGGRFKAKMDSMGVYGKVKLTVFDPAKGLLDIAPPASADAVLTFRNVHNWRMAKQAEGMFAGFFAVLKKGGTLGVVEHRAAKDVAEDDRSGYVSEAQVIALATKAGFKLGDMLFIERIAPAMALGNTSLTEAWNKAFAEVLADGSYAAVSKKYFNEDVRCN